MKTGFSIALWLSVLLPSAASAASYKLDLIVDDKQHARMTNGLEAIDSDAPHSSVRLVESEDLVRQRGVLLIYAFNAGETPVNLGPENISMVTDDGRKFEIITYEKLVKEEKKRQMWSAIAAGLAAASNTMNASMAGSSYGSINTYGSGGWARSSYTSYNPAAASIATNVANAQNQQALDRLAANRDANLASLRVNMRTSTIDPGNDFGGQVLFEVPKSLHASNEPIVVKIHVKVADEDHVFIASLSRSH